MERCGYESHGSVGGRRGDDEERDHPRRHSHHRDDSHRFELHGFVQMDSNPLKGSSSSGGGMFHFEKKRAQCVMCGGCHTNDKCRGSGAACFRCGQMGHMKRDCQQTSGVSASGLGSQASVQKENEEVIARTFILYGVHAFVLIYTGASHSFVSTRFVKRHRLTYISLDVVIYVSTLIGHSALAKSLVLGCSLEFEGSELSAHLMILAIEDFDCILDIDVLTSYRAIVDCYQKFVQFCLVEGGIWFFYGGGARPLMPLVSALKASQALEAGEEGYLIYAIDTFTDSRVVEELPLVCKYRDVFTDEITRFSPV
ncbi:uncharacterized protein [Henckelia pumila]|uniref:uncharacterized protein n=1 Tax=Henckelia pumila TaxID=405737 RepID=UPI003C6E5097